MNREISEFPPDSVEGSVPDVATARALLKERDQACLDLIAQRKAQYLERFDDIDQSFLEHAENAFVLAYTRFATRHGSWGDDFHAYHNEAHTREIFGRRIDSLCAAEGAGELDGKDWILLSLFSATHDLRQREQPRWKDGVGANERASIHESFRILALAGFDPGDDKEVFAALGMMIAGSTFDTSGASQNLNSTEAVTGGGALAPILVERMSEHHRDWQEHTDLVRRARLTLIASDLDTANVGERFPLFAESAARLCREREMRLNRKDLGASSAPHVLGFLTGGQEHYFYNLHQFDSTLGVATFGARKEKNAPLVHAMTERMRSRFGDQPSGVTGAEIIDTFLATAEELEAS